MGPRIPAASAERTARKKTAGKSIMSKAAHSAPDSASGEFACERLKARIVPAIEEGVGSRLAQGKGHLPGRDVPPRRR